MHSPREGALVPSLLNVTRGCAASLVENINDNIAAPWLAFWGQTSSALGLPASAWTATCRTNLHRFVRRASVSPVIKSRRSIYYPLPYSCCCCLSTLFSSASASSQLVVVAIVDSIHLVRVLAAAQLLHTSRHAFLTSRRLAGRCSAHRHSSYSRALLRGLLRLPPPRERHSPLHHAFQRQLHFQCLACEYRLPQISHQPPRCMCFASKRHLVADISLLIWPLPAGSQDL